MKDHSHNRMLGNRALAPETLMLGYGFDPALSEGSVKPPVFLTSTFVFTSAEQGRDFFDVVAGRKPAPEGGAGLVYSRFNHPNSEIVEDRLAIYEAGEVGAGLQFRHGGDHHRHPGDGAARRRDPAQPAALWRHGNPADPHPGQLRHCRRTVSPTAPIRRRSSWRLTRRDGRGRLSLVVIETPSNPLDTMIDIAAVRGVADRVGEATGLRPLILCDNTMLSPVFQQPLRHGADLVLASLTKYIGGHSDLIGGAVIGSRALLQPVRLLRGAIGTQLDPHSCWMVGRSLETLAVRVRAAARNAEAVIRALEVHPEGDGGACAGRRSRATRRRGGSTRRSAPGRARPSASRLPVGRRRRSGC